MFQNSQTAEKFGSRVVVSGNEKADLMEKQKILESLVRNLGRRTTSISKELKESHEKMECMDQAAKNAASEASGRSPSEIVDSFCQLKKDILQDSQKRLIVSILLQYCNSFDVQFRLYFTP